MEQTTQSPGNNKEITKLITLFILTIILLKITFHQEKILTLFQTTLALFWILILPGYCTTLPWKKQTTLTQRLIISIPTSTALLGITSYYTALAGINLKTQTILLPAIIIVLTILYYKLIANRINY